MKKMILTALTLFSIQAASAAGWSEPITIKSLWTEGASDLIGFETEGGQAYAAGCLPNYWLLTATTQERRSRAYSTLTTALTTAKKVQIWYADNCTSWSYHEGLNIKILK